MAIKFKSISTISDLGKGEISSIKEGLDEAFDEVGKQFALIKSNEIIKYFLSLSHTDQISLLNKLKNL